MGTDFAVFVPVRNDQMLEVSTGDLKTVAGQYMSGLGILPIGNPEIVWTQIWDSESVPPDWSHLIGVGDWLVRLTFPVICAN